MKKGKLLVFEGIDGAGKTTQINLLSQKLKSQGVDFKVISFPQYGKNEYANQIQNYLAGKSDSMDLYAIAKLYANDRKTAKNLIKSWLANGKLVIANRYIFSSKAHLGANLPEGKREEFMNWIDDLEYEQNNMPKEDLTILLDVDPKIGQKNSQIKNKPDIHEDNLKHLEKARQIFLELSKKEGNWMVINCMENSFMKSPEEIHQEILKIFFEKLPT